MHKYPCIVLSGYAGLHKIGRNVDIIEVVLLGCKMHKYQRSVLFLCTGLLGEIVDAIEVLSIRAQLFKASLA